MAGEFWEKGMRKVGVLLHISSLPGAGCIGTMGRHAREFVDFLHAGGQSIWQVLPLTPPALFDSPYASYSVFAGNPYFIDFEELEQEGLLPAGSFAATGKNRIAGQVDYRACGKELVPLLRKAYAADIGSKREALAVFREKHSFWLEEYALYMAIRTKQGDISYTDWPPVLSQRIPSYMSATRRTMAEQIEFWEYVQYLFFRQWEALKEYANSKGVYILGDMPIYTAEGSADVWANSKVFQVDQRLKPTAVAGVPPDAFSSDGQRWGNPLYDWEYLKETRYEWWIQRMKVAVILFDAVRIDHFRALDEYYAIPADMITAKEGKWMPGPGMEFIRAVREAVPELRLVAEDLGLMTDGVRKLLWDSGLPGMSVLLFAFDSSCKSDYLPHNHIRHSVAYIGTHDNDTAVGWMQSAPHEDVEYAAAYLGLTREEGIHRGWLRGLYASVADTAISQMQDLLGLDNAARMNVPATVGGNWSWRLELDQLTPGMAGELREMARRFGRLAEE